LQSQLAGGKPITVKKDPTDAAILAKLPEEAQQTIRDLQRKIKQSEEREQAVANKMKTAKEQ
jgi:DNA-binding Lrp family transcriptional regulator